MTHSTLYRLAIPILFCLVLAGACNAGLVFFLDQNGTLTAVQDPLVVDPLSAVKELAAGPSAVWGASGLQTEIPIGTKVKDLRIAEDTVTVDFSNEVLAGLDESSLETMFEQVNYTLRQFGFGKSVKLTCRDKLLCDYLPPRTERQAG